MKSVGLSFIFALSTVGCLAVDVSETGGIAASDTLRKIDLQEVIVVAQPKEVYGLRQQAQSSTTLDAADIKRLKIKDVRDLSAVVPSFNMPDYGSRLTSAVYVRGIGSRINSPAIGLYVDNMPVINKSAMSRHFYQIDRIDALSGPSGTLYGANTEGGVVRLFSKNPMSYQGTDMSISLSTHNSERMEVAHYHRPFEHLAFSVSGYYDRGDGYLKNRLLDTKADKWQEAGGKIRMMHTPNQYFTVDFLADYQFTRQNGFAYGEVCKDEREPQSVLTNRQSNYRRNIFDACMNVAYKRGNLQLTSSTSYQYLKDFMFMDQDYTALDFLSLIERQFSNAFSQEVNLKHRLSDNVYSTSGLFLSKEWLRTDAPVGFESDFSQQLSKMIEQQMVSGITSSMAQKFVQRGMAEPLAAQMAAQAVERAGGVSVSADLRVPESFRTPKLNFGVFQEWNMNLCNRLRLTLGLRYDYTECRIDYNTCALLSLNAAVMGQKVKKPLSMLLDGKLKKDFSELLPKMGITYIFDDKQSNLFATISKGYRQGGYNIQMFSDIMQGLLMGNMKDLAMQSGGEVSLNETETDIDQKIGYKPEVSWNYELGTHINSLSPWLTADLSLYLITISNQQLSVMAGSYGFGRMMKNAGKSRSLGFEASLRGKLLGERLFWAVACGFSHSVFTKYEDIQDGNPVDYKHKRVPFVPQNTLNIRADYTLPLNSEKFKSLVFGADLRAIGRIYWDEANTFSQPFYANLSAHTDLCVNHLTLSFWAKNLTNTHFNTFAFQSSATMQSRTFAQKGRPVTLGVDIRCNF